MRSISSIVSTVAAALCLVLGIWLYFLSSSNRSLQSDLQQVQQEAQSQQRVLQGQQQKLQTQQEQINAGNTISQQVGPALLRDMAVVSTKNDKMKELLARHGYSVEQKAEDSTAATPPQP